MTGVLRVALEEINRYLRFTDRRILIGAILLGLIVGAAWPAVQDEGLHPGTGLFTVAISDDSPLEPVIEADPSFAIIGTPRTHTLDTANLLIQGENVQYDPDQDASLAAAAQLETTARTYMDQALANEPNQDAAFPVRVNLVFQTRSLAQTAAAAADGQATPGEPDNETPTDSGTNQTPTNGNQTPSPNQTLVQQQGSKQLGLIPSEVQPPFPLKSLLYTFAYLIPLTFLGELYAGSIFSERVKNRGMLLLSTPLSGARILLGKSLPYVGVTLAVAIATTLFLGAGWIGFAASLPILGFALAASLLIGIVAPSQRSLTFLLVSTNVLLSTYLFLPAIFTEVRPVAFLSPVGVIAAAIRGEALGIAELLYSTVPLSLITIGFIAIAIGLYREETLFAPGGATTKLIDGLNQLVRTPKGFALAGLLAVPLALGIELFLLIFAVTLGAGGAFVAFLFGAAFVEEALKALPGYAHATRGPADLPRYGAWVIGILVGGGFFIAEKGVALLGLLGFDLLPRGGQALATFGVSSNLVLVLAPLALHTGTVMVSAKAAQHGRTWGIAGWLAASLLHVAYNGAIIWFLAGGLPL